MFGKAFQYLLCGLILVFLPQPPLLALEALLRQRQPLCARPQKNCQPLFHVNTGEKVEVLGQGSDPDWLQIQYPRNRQQGWIPAAAAELILPRQLLSRQIQRFSGAQAPVLLWSEEQPRILSEQQIYRLDPLQGSLVKESSLRFSVAGAEYYSPGLWTKQTVALLTRQIYEKKSFLQLQRESRQSSLPEYQTLISLSRPELPPQIALSPFLAVYAPGQGAWGPSELLLLNARGELLTLIASGRELLPFIPEELRGRIRADTLEIVALEKEGVIALLAGQFARREKLLLRLQITPALPWKYLGQLTWPDAIPWMPGKDRPRVRMVSRGQDIWLALAPAAQPEQFTLCYYSVTGQVLLQESVSQLRDLWLDTQQRLWVLTQDSLTRRELSFMEKTP